VPSVENPYLIVTFGIEKQRSFAFPIHNREHAMYTIKSFSAIFYRYDKNVGN